MGCHVNITSPIILYQPKRRKSFLQKLRNYSRKQLLSIAQQNVMSSFQGFSPGIKKMEVKEWYWIWKILMFVNYKYFKMESIIGPGMSCHPHKSRKRKLRRAMKSPPKGKAAWADIACTKFCIARPQLILVDLK